MKPGDRVQILVGGPHENFLKEATVERMRGIDYVVVLLGDRDESEWVYSPNELRKLP